MSFVSVTFVLFFLALLAVYWLLPKKLQWIWLLLGSYVFYGWNTPVFACFLLFATLITWGCSLLIHRQYRRRDAALDSKGGVCSGEEKRAIYSSFERRAKLLLVACLVGNLGLLAFLKYTNFFIDNLATLGVSARRIDWLLLPLGISFYTFQSTGYVLDVYRENHAPQNNFFRYALFVSFFPAVSQGPIARYSQLAPQLEEEHSFDYRRFTMGLERMLLGLIKKIVIASNIGFIVNRVYDDPYLYSGFVVVYATVLYAFQLYADFSGYMDIAAGAATMLGITLSENFDRPYRSRTISEYWRRWHITMGTWFKDYLYYPVLRSSGVRALGKRLSQAQGKKAATMVTTVFALLVTWLATGIWHGANWTFVLWGLWHGLCISLAMVFAGAFEKATRKLSIPTGSGWWSAFQTARTFTLVCVGYVFFRAENLHKIALLGKQILLQPFIPSAGGPYFFTGCIEPLSVPVWIFTMICTAMMLTLDRFSTNWGPIEWLEGKRVLVRWPILYAMLLILLTGIALSSGLSYDVSSFLYNGF